MLNRNIKHTKSNVNYVKTPRDLYSIFKITFSYRNHSRCSDFTSFGGIHLYRVLIDTYSSPSHQSHYLLTNISTALTRTPWLLLFTLMFVNMTWLSEMDNRISRLELSVFCCNNVGTYDIKFVWSQSITRMPLSLKVYDVIDSSYFWKQTTRLRLSSCSKTS